jgi:hypothetical protein
MDIREEIEEWFPKIVGNPFKIFKTEEKNYNCLAHTLGFDYWIWTNERWPTDVPRNLRVESFRLLYKKYGYSEISDDSYEEGYDKVAIYESHGYPLHVCKQSGNMWTSKLGGRFYILEHKLDWLSGSAEYAYGNVALILKKKF